MFFFLMIRRPPRSTRTDTTLSLHDALPISDVTGARPHGGGGGKRDRPRHLTGEQGDIAARIFMVVRAGEAEPGPLDQPTVACRLDPAIGDGDPTNVARCRLEEMRGPPRREAGGAVIDRHGREDAGALGGDTTRTARPPADH